MSDNSKYESHLKLTWWLYKLIVLVVVAVLVFVVARDAEEQFFYGIMTIAASYVFRPTEKFMDSMVLKLFGSTPPEKPEEQDTEKDDAES